MIRLGLRLALTGGREAAARLAVVVVAVAIGVATLAATLAGMHAVDAQDARSAWLATGIAPGGDTGGPGVDPLWFRVRGDQVAGEEIARVDVAATGPDAPVLPGLDALPAPGEYVASPALAELLADMPADQLADRFPGRLAGTIGQAGLPSPDMLVVVVGRTVDDLSDDGEAAAVTRVNTLGPGECHDCYIGVGVSSDGAVLVLGVVAAALLFPVLVFIGSATRLSAARREQRFAALRLVGATPRQVATLATVESVAAAAVGAVLGLALFAALRTTLADVPFAGMRSYPADLALRPVDIAAAVLGVPLAGAVAARLALRRVRVDPLATRRQAAPRRPRAWGAVLVAAGLAELAWFAAAGRPSGSGAQLGAYLSAVLVTMAGLVAAGPWLTWHGSRLVAGHARRPAGLIAGRRLADDPHAGFRAVSGLVLALFVGTTAVGAIASVRAAARPTVGADTLIQSYGDDRPDALPDGLVDDLAGLPGVRGVAVLHEVGPDVPPEVAAGDGAPGAAGPWQPPSFAVTCAELARTPSLGRCPDGAAAALVDGMFAGSVIEGAPEMADVTWPAADLAAAEVTRRPVSHVAVENDGRRDTIERARTLLEVRAGTPWGPPLTIAETNAQGSRDLQRLQHLADVVIAASLAIAGCSLAVNVAAGLNDRRRPFGLLRLSGAPLALLRRVVTLEAAVPLVATAVVAAGTGFLTAHLFVRAQLERSLSMPGPSYWLVVGAGLAVSLAVIASTLPLLDRLTAPRSARTD